MKRRRRTDVLVLIRKRWRSSETNTAFPDVAWGHQLSSGLSAEIEIAGFVNSLGRDRIIRAALMRIFKKVNVVEAKIHLLPLPADLALP